MKTLDELMQPDVRTLRFTPLSLSLQGTMRPEDSFAFIQGRLETTHLDPKVPEDLRKQFDTIRSLHVYGFFVYEFFTIAFSQALFLLEEALKLSFAEQNPGENPPRDLKRLFIWATEAGAGPLARITQIASQEQLDALRQLRNEFAHPSRPTILTPINSAELIKCCVLLLNALWLPSSHEDTR